MMIMKKFLSIYSLMILFGIVSSDDYVHNPIQYQSQSDKGSYNFGYDTGLSGAHQFHQESKDDSGLVRGRYGYTDPDGKLRLVYYSSGSNGFQAWGPDLPQPVSTSSPPHSSESSLSSSSSSSYVSKSVEPSKASYQAEDSSKVSSRFTYPLSPAGRIAAIKSAKIVAIPVTTTTTTTTPAPVKTVQKEEYVTKTLYSPAEKFRARYTSDEPTKTAPIRQQVETKGSRSQIVVEQSVKSASIKSSNRPVPITPVQYRANYPPAGKYSRCYCE
ncbi:uncharacterized protein LOC128391281 [Panonychus citri]|uniref:uncharacterized protein LOC128391281 n=1 Tax=Panonychus citri TaxID=50023 RepID=UPI002307D330|nr:uncharacterized protein LOC128391281 [Panonychus citri]